MNSARVKICGITRAEDALAAARAGAAAIGLVFAEGSSRQVSIEQAESICRDLPPWLGVVGLFMDHSADYVHHAMRAVPMNWLQFHGAEDEAFCQSFARPYIKAIPMLDDRPDWSRFASASAVLLDAHAPGQPGGSGSVFDWTSLTPPARPWILAGGLNVDNVVSAVAQLQPPALDVSSGVESSPGIKDEQLMRTFIQVVQHG
ncbi:MAG: phosphoribosylanthranilate isomerase [Pseudomonadota bacterium]